VMDDADLSGKKIALFGVGDQGAFHILHHGVGADLQRAYGEEALVVGVAAEGVYDGEFHGDQDAGCRVAWTRKHSRS
jgi:hypothetical protein